MMGSDPQTNRSDEGDPASRLAKVPEHWEIRRLRTVLRRVTERNRPDLPLLSVVREKGVILRDISDSRENHNYIPDDLSNYKVVRKAQFAINKMKAWQGSFGVSAYDGIVSPAYHVYKVTEVESDFFHVAIRSRAYVPYFSAASDGVRIGQWDLSATRMRDIPFAVPTELEQSRIVRFLDHADQRIQRYIRAKERLIELLEELKQAIIHQAVTGQVDVRTGQPYPAYKDSGVEWLGEVPEHWELSRVKSEFESLNRHRIPLSSVERGNMISRQYDYYGASGIIDKVDDYLFDDELLLIAEDGANLVLRNLPLAIIATGKFWVNNHAHILKPRRGNIEFLAWLMESLSYLPWISGAAQPKLTQDRLMGITIAVPPHDEQNEIIALMKGRTIELTSAVSRVNQEIDLLREYRVRLIADVVTGELDVRETVASLTANDPSDNLEAQVTTQGAIANSARPQRHL